MRTLCLFLLAGGMAFAQLDDDTITVVAGARVTAPPPGSIVVTATVRTPAGAGLDEVLTALAPAGLSENDLAAFNPSTCAGDFQCVTTLGWTFRFTASVASASDVLAKLSRAASGAKQGISLSYTVASAGDPSASGCAYPTLISIARTHATNLATAAGVRVGRIVALADGPAAQNVIPTVASAWFSVGAFILDPLIGRVLTPAPPTGCMAVVQFQLLR